ncbi:Copine-9 [Takifugu flavidus]|uniref:Copine-9 n=1 Tax=Takifugu flavidus TaxID=433684 RepID=A0A5C6MN92_9TELE|nr:Copine-9 [Takifugu flavidus]
MAEEEIPSSAALNMFKTGSPMWQDEERLGQSRWFTICHKTEVIKNTLNPVWQPFTIPVRALCNGDYDRTVKVDVYDWDRDGSHDFIGEFTTSYRELSRGQNQFSVYEVTLLSFKVESEHTFVDFICGGCAAQFTDGSQYSVLLMITDGVISDMVQTKEAVVNAASLPLSIIIVGVGPAEFDAMEELDGDEVRVSFQGRLAERDIVQFVPFRDYIDRSGNQVLSMARLAKDVLAEIPDQLLSFMKSRGIHPRPAVPSCPLPELHN